MYEYTTFADLRSISGEMLPEERSRVVKAATDRSPSGSTFLSHSTKDAEFLPAVIRILEGHGARVYVDKKDPELPPTTSRQTATVLRSRIQVISKFILFATTNSKESKWMPWELGIADGYKATRNVAIFPSVENRSDFLWSEREYLGVYDRVVWGELEGREKPLWIVLNQEANTAATLSDWIQR